MLNTVAVICLRHDVVCSTVGDLDGYQIAYAIRRKIDKLFSKLKLKESFRRGAHTRGADG